MDRALTPSIPLAALVCATASLASAQTTTNTPALASQPAASTQNWNWHVQNTDLVQGYPSFPAKYSGPNSLPTGGETRETVSLDLMAGLRLWPGAEAHLDGLLWQGFGVNNTLGVDGFPNGEAFRKDFAGRPTPLYLCKRLTEQLGGAKIT